MVNGRVKAYDGTLQPQINLQVRGEEGRTAQVEAIVDTGFTEHLTLSSNIVRNLALKIVSIREFTLANGARQEFETYRGTVEWDGQRRDIEIHSSESDPLVGMAMLRDHDLHVRAIPDGPVSINPLSLDG